MGGRLYTKEQDEFLRAHINDGDYHYLAEIFNEEFGDVRSWTGVRDRCVLHLGLKDQHKSRTPIFTKETSPRWQKGLHGEAFKAHYTEESYARCNAKNAVAGLKYKVGDRMTYHGCPYIVVAPPPGDCSDIQHRIQSEWSYVWEKANGPIPDGYCIIHLDRNVWNNDLSNLRMVSRSIMKSLHGYGWYEGREQITESGIELLTLIQEIQNANKDRHSDA